MSSGSSTPQNVVTTQNKDPWSGAQPYISGVLGAAAGLYGSDTGYQPWSGATMASIDPTLQAGLDTNQARWGNPDYGRQVDSNAIASAKLAGNMVASQGVTPGVQGAIGGLGQVNDIYGNIAGLNGGLNQNQYNTLSGLDTASNLYGSMYNQADGAQNPYLQSMLDAQGRKIADQVNSAMSGAGRYGSGAHTNVLSRNLAEAADPILAQDYQARQQQKLAALQGQQSVYGQKLGVLQQGLGNQMSGAQGMGQTQQTIADLYGQGLNRAGQYSQLMPTINDTLYDTANRITDIGNWYQGRQQQNLDQQINLYNAQQARPWEQLARYSALANGAGGLGGTTVQTTPNLNAPVGGISGGLGGALAGGAAGSIFGPVGAGIGALGGGLLGYLR